MKWFPLSSVQSEITAPIKCLAVPVVSIIVPTFNERDNIALVISAVSRAMQGSEWEIVVVDDDSPDGTYAFVKALAHVTPRLRCIRRIGRRGLAGAVIEGFLSSSADYVAVIDADMQHDEALLPQMLSQLQNNLCDISIASRYADGACDKSLGHWRSHLSRAGRVLARSVMHADIQDPMSGFFMMRRELFETVAPRLRSRGFKILVDILASSPHPLRVSEIPFIFRPRHAGVSKLNTATKLDYLSLILAKQLRRRLPRKAT